MDKQEIKQRIREYFKNNNDYLPEEDEDLFENSVLDSYGVVDFLTFLEEELGAKINIEDITMENFSTIQKIVNLIQK